MCRLFGRVAPNVLLAGVTGMSRCLPPFSRKQLVRAGRHVRPGELRGYFSLLCARVWDNIPHLMERLPHHRRRTSRNYWLPHHNTASKSKSRTAAQSKTFVRHQRVGLAFATARLAGDPRQFIVPCVLRIVLVRIRPLVPTTISPKAYLRRSPDQSDCNAHKNSFPLDRSPLHTQSRA